MQARIGFLEDSIRTYLRARDALDVLLEARSVGGSAPRPPMWQVDNARLVEERERERLRRFAGK